ncbi:ATP-binding cassette domain-containing protein [Pandoraea fibrosis]|uniref:ATP-binding cassette domain-containing protein n=1 Tax=Pandoraea fibrosis TaxID=1891094 RepID=A0ABX6HR99_9BURK|nr:ABC transporter ATP-binding protein [Pandoraea fibrosis]QHE93012.1 ATP-binding cassette domain-containing protein [Pandoraea fibrosis]QHF13430.1 ATP-binding cassette domain-containing protein [Pandoraea fibrosis]
MSDLLTLEGVTHRFGGVVAARDVSFSLRPGEIVGLIGPNGAGKTTLINLVTGVIKPSAGSIHFEGQRISGLPPHRIARSGIARTYQIVQPFPAMTVLENVEAAALFGGGAASRAEASRRAQESLETCGLGDIAEANAGALSLAERKRLEFAKALALRPRLLLLDEVNAGLNASELDEAIALTRRLAAQGVTILLVEHLMRLVLQVCDRILVLHQGALIADGAPAQIVENDAVIAAYLGQRYQCRKREGTS